MNNYEQPKRRPDGEAPGSGRSTNEDDVRRRLDDGEIDERGRSDAEPGPSDDDGLPDNAKRRVPS